MISKILSWSRKRESEKPKRDIFRFNGAEDMTIDLGRVYKMVRSGKKITFQSPSATTADYIEMESEELAKTVYETLLTHWAGK